MYNNGGFNQQQFNGGNLAPQRTGFQQPVYGQVAPQQTGYQQPFQQQPPLTSFQSQYGQSAYAQPQQQLYPQATGYIQPQATGYVGGTSYLQSQPTGYQQQQQQPLAPQPTGFISAAQKVEKNEELKIPNIRLSFLTAQDQMKYETLFRSAVAKGSNSISAEAARDILVKSNLQPQQLGQIWELSDLNKSGQLLFPEFALSLHLVNIALSGKPIPQVLDGSVKREVEGFVDAINFSVPDEEPRRSTPFDNLGSTQQSSLNQLGGLSFGQPQAQPLLSQATGYQPLQPQRTGFQSIQPQVTGYQPLQSQVTGYQPLQPQVTGYQPLQPQSTGFQPLQSQNTGFQPLQQQRTGFSQPLQAQATGFGQLQAQATGFNSFMSQNGSQANYNPPALLQAQKTGVGNNNLFQTSLLQPQRTGFQNLSQYQNVNNSQDFSKPQEKALFSKIFDTYDSQRTGRLDAQTSSEIFRKSGLNRQVLEKVWNLITTDSTTHLDKESFSLGMWLIYKKLNGHELPNSLPDSLLPQSVKILNDVKNTLKTTQTSSSSFGSSFKNNDNDINSSKNRRKVDDSKKEDELDSLRSQVEQKKSLLDFVSNENKSLSIPQSASPDDSENLKIIEDLKNQIRALPVPAVSDDRLQLKTKLTSLTSRVPELIHEISRIDNEISDSRIELYKIKHPSSIIGTGPNGEVTESDKLKAKNKAMLLQRMNRLTGKSSPVIDFDQQQKEFDDEVSRIRNSNKETQEIIYDIEKSIKELSEGAQNSLNRDGDASSYRKFELGLDIQPEVGAFIKELRVSSKPAVSKNISSIPKADHSAPPPVNHATKPSTPDSYSSFKTPEERAAFIKEQAKKKMNERLARFGLSRNKKAEVEAEPEITSPPAASSPVVSQSSTPVATAQQTQVSTPPLPPVQRAAPPAVVKAPAPPPPVKRSTLVTKPVKAEVSDDEEDEEEAKLREQLEELKLKKKANKEAKLAQLRKELEDAEKDDDDDDDDLSRPQTFAPQVSQAKQVSPAPVAATPIANPDDFKHHDSNPFAKGPGASQQTPVATPVAQAPPSGSSNNPFGKPQFFQKTDTQESITPIDSKKIEAQRKAQRGFDEDEDDGWGSEGEKSDDEEEAINRQGAAHLAGLLFSGMGPARTNSSNQILTPKEEPKTIAAPAKPVPIAAPIPSVPVTTVPATSVPEPVEEATSASQDISVQQPVQPIAPPPIPSFNAALAEPVAPPPIPSFNAAPAEPVAPPPVPNFNAAPNETPNETGDIAPSHQPVQTSTQGYLDQSQGYFNAVPPTTAAPEVPSDYHYAQEPEQTYQEPPQLEAPPPPPLPSFSAPPLENNDYGSAAQSDGDEFTTPTAPSPDSEAYQKQEASGIQPPTYDAPPPLPTTSAPPPPPLPSSSAPPPPPLPAVSAPPPPPLPVAAPPSAAAPAAPAAPAIGGLPFLAEINKRRDDANVVG